MLQIDHLRPSRARASGALLPPPLELAPCLACDRIERAMRADPETPGRDCVVCGTQFVRVPQAPKERAPRRVLPRSPSPERRVTAFVRDVLALHAARLRVESAGGLSSFVLPRSFSSTLFAMRCAESGIVGDGCKGTRGARHGIDMEPRELPPVAIDEGSERRYSALDGATLETAEAVVADGHGDRVVGVEVGGREHELTLERRLGLRLADPATVKRWLALAAKRDAGPMLAGAAEVGEKRLSAAAEVWWSA